MSDIAVKKGKEKMLIFAILGVCGGLCTATGDMLLELKGKGNLERQVPVMSKQEKYQSMVFMKPCCKPCMP